MNWEVLLTVLAAALGGGGVATVLQTRSQNVKNLADASATAADASMTGVEAAEKALAIMQRSYESRLLAVEEEVKKARDREEACQVQLAAVNAHVADHRRVLALVVRGLDKAEMSPTSELKTALMAAQSILSFDPRSATGEAFDQNWWDDIG